MDSSKYFKVLSIDGGGIRGIIPGQVLVSIEKKLQEKTNNPNARIADYFDMIAGTSTGGILTIAHLCPHDGEKNRPKFNAQEVVDIYLEKGGKIFSASWWSKKIGKFFDEEYSAKELENVLKEKFGDIKLSQLIKPCLITSYDIKRRKGHFFTQHNAVNDSSYDFYVKDIARATSAAPTYFECANVSSLTGVYYPLIDGGVFVNNPTLCAYAEVRKKFNKTAKEMAILSLGTGFVRKPYDYNKAKNWGAAEWLKPLIDIMMSGVADVVDYQIKQMYDAVKAPEQYLRINTEIPIDVSSEMDDVSEKNLQALKALGIETAEKNSDVINNFIENFIIK
jgi:patatin-like phospholipase/acyl hydrolase